MTKINKSELWEKLVSGAVRPWKIVKFEYVEDEGWYWCAQYRDTDGEVIQGPFATEEEAEADADNPNSKARQ